MSVILPVLTILHPVLQVEQLLQALLTGEDVGQVGRELGIEGGVEEERDEEEDQDDVEEQLARELGMTEGIGSYDTEKEVKQEGIQKKNEEEDEEEVDNHPIVGRKAERIQKGSKFCPSEIRRKCEAAAKDISEGKFRSVRKAAKFHNVCFNTLHKGLKSGGVFQGGRGRKSHVFTEREEKDLVAYIKSLAIDLSPKQVQRAIQEALLDVIKDHPERKTGLEDCGQMPHTSWVRRFVIRNRISMTRSSTQGGFSKTVTRLMEEKLNTW